MQNYHFKLIHESSQEDWAEMAPVNESAVRLFNKNLGIELNFRVIGDHFSYRMEKYAIDDSGRVLLCNVLDTVYLG